MQHVYLLALHLSEYENSKGKRSKRTREYIHTAKEKGGAGNPVHPNRGAHKNRQIRECVKCTASSEK